MFCYFPILRHFLRWTIILKSLMYSWIICSTSCWISLFGMLSSFKVFLFISFWIVILTCFFEIFLNSCVPSLFWTCAVVHLTRVLRLNVLQLCRDFWSTFPTRPLRLFLAVWFRCSYIFILVVFKLVVLLHTCSPPYHS